MRQAQCDPNAFRYLMRYRRGEGALSDMGGGRESMTRNWGGASVTRVDERLRVTHGQGVLGDIRVKRGSM